MGGKIWFSALVLLGGGIVLAAAAETNSMPAFSCPFTLSQSNSIAKPNFIAPQTTSLRSEMWFTTASGMTAHHEAGDLATTRHFELIKPAPKPDNFLTRGFNSIFEPEEFHVGKTTICCSVATAIKRKNPLCLLNPLVLNVSW
jgi:hypothetical protein